MFLSLKEALVYSIKDNTMQYMIQSVLAKCKSISIFFSISLFNYSDLTLIAKLETDFVLVPITIPKEAICMDIRSDALQVKSKVDKDVERSSFGFEHIST